MTHLKSLLLTLLPVTLLVGCNLFLDLAPMPAGPGPEDAQQDVVVDHDMATDAAQDMATDVPNDMPAQDMAADAAQDMVADAAQDMVADAARDMVEDTAQDMEMDAAQDMGPTVRPIGLRPVLPTPLSQGTLFASPNGTGTTCSQTSPCRISQAASRAVASDVVFLRGGVYPITQSLYLRGGSPPVTYESFPNESAILDGSTLTAADDVTIRVSGDPIIMRRLTIQNMPKNGISVSTSRHLFEGLFLIRNLGSGIDLDGSPTPNRNTIRDSLVMESGAGGKADGISISVGDFNRIENCLVYQNSDDGIDIWQSTNTYIGYSIVQNHRNPQGGGNGIRAGGAAPAADAVVEHNLSYSNLQNGFDFNSGANVTFKHNTSWDNLRGFELGNDTVTTHNIAYESSPRSGGGTQLENSWQRAGTPTPMSTDFSSPDFLVPAGSDFTDIGAHAGR